MTSLPLPQGDDLTKPAFTDKASCAAWVQQLQLTNLHQAHGILRAQLDALNRTPLRGLQRLQTLELFRETVVLVQNDYAKKLISKKLPLNDDELTIFNAIVSLWQGLVTAYQLCLKACQEENQLAELGPLITQRCLRYTGMQIFEHLRSSYEFKTSLWQQLHTFFDFAEKHHFHQQTVEDAVHAAGYPCSCQAVYIKTLLACHAHPAELSRRQLQLLDRWLSQWNEALIIERSTTPGKDDAPPLVVDLAGTQGIQTVKQIAPTATTRFLPMVPLSKLLRVKTILLQQGQTPQQLELGSDCTVAECADLLTRLLRYWCEGITDRQAERRTIAQSAELCFGIEGAYAHIAHKPFKQAKKGIGLDTIARKQIVAFGRVLADTNRHDLSKLGFSLETWHVENESILGARIIRENILGERLSPQQFVALKASDANAFMLGKVSWAIVTLDKQLRIGIQYFPGMAQPVSIKGQGINPSASEKSEAALLLPAVPALKSPASLIMPREFFRPERPVAITHQDGLVQTVKLKVILDRGVDFERVGFQTDQ